MSHIKQNQAILLALAALCAASTSHAQQTWDGGASTNEWMDVLNWSGDTLPTAESAGISGETVVLTGAAGTISFLNIGASNGSNDGSLDVQTGGSLTLGPGTSWQNNSGLLTVSGGAVTFSGGGNDIVRFSHRSGSNDRFVITDGSMTFDGVRPQGFTGDFDVTVSGGSLNLTANQTRGFAVVGAEGTSTLTLSGTGQINSAGHDLGIGEVPGDNAPTNGNGTMNMTGGTLSLNGGTADLLIGAIDHNSTGTANLSGGVATVGGNTVLNQGSLNVSGTVDYTTDDLLLSDGTSLTVDGSSIADFSVTSNATLNDSNITFTADTGFTTIDITGVLDLGLADLIIDLNGLTAGTYTLFNYGTMIGSAFENVTFQNGAGSIDYGTGTSSSISITAAAIPEPGTYALLAGLLGLSYVMVRRRA